MLPEQSQGGTKRVASGVERAIEEDQARHWAQYRWEDFEMSETAWRITHMIRTGLDSDAEVLGVLYTHYATHRPFVVLRGTACYVLYFQAPSDELKIETIRGAAIANVSERIADVDRVYEELLGPLQCDPLDVERKFLADVATLSGACMADEEPESARRVLNAPRRLVESMEPDCSG